MLLGTRNDKMGETTFGLLCISSAGQLRRHAAVCVIPTADFIILTLPNVGSVLSIRYDKCWMALKQLLNLYLQFVWGSILYMNELWDWCVFLLDNGGGFYGIY